MKNKSKLLALLVSIFFATLSCSKDNDDGIPDKKDPDKIDIQITTKPLSNLTPYSLISGGKINGTSPIKERGICWDNTNKLPDINGLKVSDIDPVIGEYNLKIINLDPNSIYYLRAYAITTSGEAVYGNTIDFTTDKIAQLPESNCYINTPDNALVIPVSRANQSSLGAQISSRDKLSAELLWMDNEDVVDAVFTEGVGESGRIVVLTGSVTGNAVVAVKANDKIKWSWHIWVSEDAKSLGVIEMPSGVKLMDRNLGATTKAIGEIGAVGVQFQFGRKDPFTASGEFGSASELLLYDLNGKYPTIEIVEGPKDFTFTLENPLTFVTSEWIDWADEDIRDWWKKESNIKTVYDPCPVGWKVPAIDDYTGLADEHFDKTIEGGHKFIYKDQSNYFPFTGYREVKGTLDATGVFGTFWVNSTIEDDPGISAAYSPTFGQGGTAPINGAPRARGLSIRCIKE